VYSRSEKVRGNVLQIGEIMLIDSHAHLDTPAFDADRAEVIARARAQGVELCLEIAGSDVAQGSLDTGIALAEQHDFIYAAVGLLL
jgi:TatD DNase family protein